VHSGGFHQAQKINLALLFIPKRCTGLNGKSTGQDVGYVSISFNLLYGFDTAQDISTQTVANHCQQSDAHRQFKPDERSSTGFRVCFKPMLKRSNP